MGIAASVLPKSAPPPHNPFSPKKRKRSVTSTGPLTLEDRGGGSPRTGTSASSPSAKKTKHQTHTGSRDSSGTSSPLFTVPWRFYDPFDTWPRIPDAQGLQTFREYGQFCYLYKRNQESHYHPGDCMKNQPQLTVRSRLELISWLIPVHKYFGLGFESLCLAVNILDRFLSCMPVEPQYFQLVGVTSLLIACKQVETRPPEMEHLLALCCGAFSREQLSTLEREVLLTLNFSLEVPTIDFFLQHFTLQRIAEDDPSDYIKQLRTLVIARRIAELSLADYAFHMYSPSLMAICCLAVGDRLLGQNIYAITGGHPLQQLVECLEKMDVFVSVNHHAVYNILPSNLPSKILDMVCTQAF